MVCSFDVDVIYKPILTSSNHQKFQVPKTGGTVAYRLFQRVGVPLAYIGVTNTAYKGEDSSILGT